MAIKLTPIYMKSQIFEQNSDCAHFVTFTIWQNMLTQLQYVSEQTRGFFQIQMNHYIHTSSF